MGVNTFIQMYINIADISRINAYMHAYRKDYQTLV